MRTTLLILMTSICLNAAPAFERERIFIQPDGKTFTGKFKGDEYLNWIETDQGDILLYHPKRQRYEFAETNTTDLFCSGRAYDPTIKNSAQRSLTDIDLQQIRQYRYKKELKRRNLER